MINTDKSFHVATNLSLYIYPTSSIVAVEEKRRSHLSITQDQMFSMDERYDERAGQANCQEPSMSRSVRTRRSTSGLALSTERDSFSETSKIKHSYQSSYLKSEPPSLQITNDISRNCSYRVPYGFSYHHTRCRTL
ncbi:hypothetical protein TNCV_2692031 [Trichonephila clavipes]|uniref:Uncharacterized protein n=1 Tax=Trichonephila clavipes TaxID=2585209 RepID=A0A8X6VYQ0_TRICX|nr:hypothetical protein TNCV_2692031 [Trichonephila clavipes]